MVSKASDYMLSETVCSSGSMMLYKLNCCWPSWPISDVVKMVSYSFHYGCFCVYDLHTLSIEWRSEVRGCGVLVVMHV